MTIRWLATTECGCAVTDTGGQSSAVVLPGVCMWNENPERENGSFVVDSNSAPERAASLQGIAEKS